jgi:hypothetical protein
MLPSMSVVARVLILSWVVVVAVAAEPVTRSPETSTVAPVNAGTPAVPAVAGAAQAVPASPSTVPGVRIWPAPTFTHWPAVVYPDEDRNVAFALPVRTPGASGTIGWEGEKSLPFTLPTDLERISGLLPLPKRLGLHTATLGLGEERTALRVRLVDARELWPIAALRESFPVDSAQVPVVLVDRRRDPAQERKWALVQAMQRPRPTGKAVFVGDPLRAMGASACDQLDVRLQVAVDDRQPTHAQLVGFARDQVNWAEQPLTQGPRTIMWSPGNRAVLHNTWSAEEERFLGVVRTRCEALGIYPRLVLLLPPAPIDDRVPGRELAAQRRELLRRAAAVQGWVVLDVERLAGPAEESYRLGEGVFAEGPVGEGREKLAAALSAELVK